MSEQGSYRKFMGKAEFEKAVKLRKAGHRIVIVHENDFHDAVADQ